MKRITLKGTDLTVSRVCYGTGNFKERLSREDAFRMLDCYTDAGGNMIDTANVYCRWLPDTANCAEEYIGQWLRSSGKRQQVVLATKGGHPDLQTWTCRVTREDLKQDVDESLATLGVDYVDFYWFHRDNPNLPIEEVIDMGEELVRAGKVRYYGASNFTLPRMMEALEWQKTHPGKGFRALSNQWSLAYPNPGYKLNGDTSLEGIDHSYYLWLCRTGLPLIPFSASAGGFFGKFHDGKLSPTLESGYVNLWNRKLDELLQPMAEKYHTTPLVLSMAVLMEQQKFQVIPVIAASNQAQLLEILKADDIELQQEDLDTLNRYF